MYLSASRLNVLAEVMRTLAEPHEEADIRARVGDLMLQLLGAQYYASYVWDDGLQSFDGRVQINMDPGNLLQYERYYQYRDPITPLLQQHRTAVLVSDVLPRAQFTHTEFFNDFLARGGLHWGINLYAWDGSNNIGDMRIWRDSRNDDFGDVEKQILDFVRPAFVAALRRCRLQLVAGAPVERVGCTAVERGEPRLSEREREVANLAACGLSDKEIARRLGIAITTVRTHIDHAFRKLKVDSRIKLAIKLNP